MELTTLSMHVRSGQAELRCDVVGDGVGDSPTLIFLHAGVADRRSWSAVTRELGRTHRTVAYDRRGFGETTYEPESYSHADDLLAVINALGGEKVILIGNSQGGRIAIDFALAHPERVIAMVLVGPALSGEAEPTSLSGPASRLAAVIDAADEAGDLEQVNRLEAHFWLDGPSSTEGRVGGSARALFLDMNQRALSARSPGEERPPRSAVDRLGELAMPVHVVVGELDLQFVNERGQRIAQGVRRGTLTEFRGAAHLPQLEQPDAFIREIRQFLSRVDREE
ncbi:MAG: alpha/beta hydrolase [Proteobacteria bacterium]|nr:alpha/beta hydrolase [Pseudomonadota bacterium]